MEKILANEQQRRIKSNTILACWRQNFFILLLVKNFHPVSITHVRDSRIWKLVNTGNPKTSDWIEDIRKGTRRLSKTCVFFSHRQIFRSKSRNYILKTQNSFEIRFGQNTLNKCFLATFSREYGNKLVFLPMLWDSDQRKVNSKNELLVAFVLLICQKSFSMFHSLCGLSYIIQLLFRVGKMPEK